MKFFFKKGPSNKLSKIPMELWFRIGPQHVLLVGGHSDKTADPAASSVSRQFWHD